MADTSFSTPGKHTSSPNDYSKWSHSSLVERVTELESQLRESNLNHRNLGPLSVRPKKRRAERAFDPSKYSTRFIAVKLAYLGQRYGGFEHHANNPNALKTIESELYKALSRGRLIFPKNGQPLDPGEVNWEGCDYSKCGRTDRGVSAFGQVIGLRVRSNRPLPLHDGADREAYDEKTTTRHENIVEGEDDLEPEPKYFDHIKDEIPYAQMLNRLLPEDIRVLAWCPSPPPDFSARFSCRERRYKYFFTQPAFPPSLNASSVNGVAKERHSGWLDVAAMREAAHQYVGVHDFRNFCKVDPGKQITNFDRRIFRAEIEELKPSEAPVSFVGAPAFRNGNDDRIDVDGLSGTTNASPLKVYSFTLHGSAFLWHQVRHMVAILFLVGQGLESPSIVSELLNVQKNPTRPQYEMAPDAPLVLWDCIFPHPDDETRKDALDWIYIGSGPKTEKQQSKLTDGKFGPGGLVDNLWSVWRRKKIDELLAGSLLDLVACSPGKDTRKTNDLAPNAPSGKRSQLVFAGGDSAKLAGMYIPVLEKARMEPVEVINKKWLEKKGQVAEATKDSVE